MLAHLPLNKQTMLILSGLSMSLVLMLLSFRSNTAKKTALKSLCLTDDDLKNTPIIPYIPHTQIITGERSLATPPEAIDLSCFPQSYTKETPQTKNPPLQGSLMKKAAQTMRSMSPFIPFAISGLIGDSRSHAITAGLGLAGITDAQQARNLIASQPRTTNQKKPDSGTFTTFIPGIRGHAILALPDGSLITVGSKKQGRRSSLLVIKTDPSGHIEWCRKIGNGDIRIQRNTYDTTRIKLTKEGGYIIAHPSPKEDHPSFLHQSILLIKLDANGEKQWMQYLYSPDYLGTHRYAMMPDIIVNDAGYIVASTFGQTKTRHYYHITDNTITIAAIKPNAEIRWHKTLQGLYDERMAQINDKHLIMSAYCQQDYSGRLIMFDPTDGRIAWSKQIGSFRSHHFEAIQAMNKGFVVTGNTRLRGGGSCCGFFINAYDINGGKIWGYAYLTDNTHITTSLLVQLTNNHELLVTGMRFRIDALHSSDIPVFFVVKLAEDGEIQWAIHPNHCRWKQSTSAAIVELPNNQGAALVGHIAYPDEMFITKISPSGVGTPSFGSFNLERGNYSATLKNVTLLLRNITFMRFLNVSLGVNTTELSEERITNLSKDDCNNPTAFSPVAAIGIIIGGGTTCLMINACGLILFITLLKKCKNTQRSDSREDQPLEQNVNESIEAQAQPIHENEPEPQQGVSENEEEAQEQLVNENQVLSINGHQKTSIRFTLKYMLLDDLADVTPTNAVRILESLTDEAPVNAQDFNAIKSSNEEKPVDFSGDIKEIRRIFTHPYPQNRTVHYPGAGAQTDPNIITYMDEDGNMGKEWMGVFNLTPLNNRGDKPTKVTSKATKDYMHELINSHLQGYRTSLIRDTLRFFPRLKKLEQLKSALQKQPTSIKITA
jgi:hypothetical protein